MGKRDAIAAGEATELDVATVTPADSPDPIKSTPVQAPDPRLAQMIVPTIGRRVWWRCNGNESATKNLGVFDETQPCDAGITYVWADSLVNVTVTGPSGIQCAFTSVHLRQPGYDPAPEGTPYVEWIPHQVSAAAK